MLEKNKIDTNLIKSVLREGLITQINQFNSEVEPKEYFNFLINYIEDQSISILKEVPAPSQIKADDLSIKNSANINLLPIFQIPIYLSQESSPEKLIDLYWKGDLIVKREVLIRLANIVVEFTPHEIKELLPLIPISNDPYLLYPLSLLKSSINIQSFHAITKEYKNISLLFREVKEKIQKFLEGEKVKLPWEELTPLQWRSLGIWLKEAESIVVYSLGKYLLNLWEHKLNNTLVNILENLIPSGDERLIAPLKGLLRVGDPETKRLSAYILGVIADPRIKPILKSAANYLNCEIEKIGIQAALGLQREGDPSYLHSILCDRNREHFWEESLRALRYCNNEESEEIVLKLLENGSPQLVKEAIRTLEFIGSTRSIPILDRIKSKYQFLSGLIEVTLIAINERKNRGVIKDEVASSSFANLNSTSIIKYKEGDNKPTFLDQLRGIFYYIKGSVYLNAGKLEDAIRELKKGLNYKPNNINLLIKLASAYIYKGDYESGIEILSTIYNQHPVIINNKKFLNLLTNTYIEQAMYYLNKGQYTASISLIKELENIGEEILGKSLNERLKEIRQDIMSKLNLDEKKGDEKRE